MEAWKCVGLYPEMTEIMPSDTKVNRDYNAKHCFCLPLKLQFHWRVLSKPTSRMNKINMRINIPTVYFFPANVFVCSCNIWSFESFNISSPTGRLQWKMWNVCGDYKLLIQETDIQNKAQTASKGKRKAWITQMCESVFVLVEFVLSGPTAEPQKGAGRSCFTQSVRRDSRMELLRK